MYLKKGSENRCIQVRDRRIKIISNISRELSVSCDRVGWGEYIYIYIHERERERERDEYMMMMSVIIIIKTYIIITFIK